MWGWGPFFGEPEGKVTLEATLGLSLSELLEADAGSLPVFSPDLSIIYLPLPHRPGKSGRVLGQLVSAFLQGQNLSPLPRPTLRSGQTLSLLLNISSLLPSFLCNVDYNVLSILWDGKKTKKCS